MIESLEDLLSMQLPIGAGCIAPPDTPMSLEFRVAVQPITDKGVHVILHASGHNSETADLLVKGDTVTVMHMTGETQT